MNLSPNESWPIPFDPSWNVVDSTKLNSLIACPRKYFYEYTLGWRPEVPSNHLVFGSAVHEALEHLILTDYSNENIQLAHEKFLKHYRRTFGPETDDIYHPKTPLNLLIVLSKYCSHPDYRDDHKLFDVLYTEISGTINVDEDVILAFRMDTILKRRSSGKILSLEHKTGSSTFFWSEQWPMSIQIGTYSHVLNCLFPAEDIEGVTMNGMFFFKPKNPWAELSSTGKNVKYKPPYDFMRYPIKRDNQQMAVWQWNVLYYFNQLKFYYEMLSESSDSDMILQTFPMRQDSCVSYGKLCPYYDFCMAWPNPLKRCQEPPIGYDISFWNPLEKEAKHEFQL